MRHVPIASNRIGGFWRFLVEKGTHMNMNQNQNLFFSTSVWNGCAKAQNIYLRVLTSQQGKLSVGEIEREWKWFDKEVTAYMDAASKAAFMGDIPTAKLQLAQLPTIWASFKAYDDLYNAYRYLDPKDLDIAANFDLAVEAKVVYWATLLQNEWRTGEQARAAGKQADVLTYQSKALLESTAQQKELFARSKEIMAQGQQGVVSMSQFVAQVHSQNTQLAGVIGKKMEVEVKAAEAGVKAVEARTENVRQSSPNQTAVRGCLVSCLTRGILVLMFVLVVVALAVIGHMLLLHGVLTH